MSTTFNPATLEFIRKQQAKRTKRRAIASIAGVLLVAGIAIGGWYGYMSNQETEKADLATEIVAGFEPGNGRAAWEKGRAAVGAGLLTRDQLEEAGRAAWEKREREVMEGYFNTPAKEREKFLDNIIDQMQKQMAEWRRDRPTTNPTTRPNRDDRPTTRPNEGDADRQAQREAQARQRTDNQSPIFRAQNAEFRAALQARMKERGIEMRGRGGPGGRRGAGGGGGR